MNFTVTPGCAAWNWAPIVSKASVSEVAANTTIVPEMFPDAAEALPDAEVLLDDDELHAVNATPAPRPLRPPGS